MNMQLYKLFKEHCLPGNHEILGLQPHTKYILFLQFKGRFEYNCDYQFETKGQLHFVHMNRFDYDYI